MSSVFWAAGSITVGLGAFPSVSAHAEAQDPLPPRNQAVQGRGEGPGPGATSTRSNQVVNAPLENPLDPAACLKRLPPANAAPTAYREIYEKFRQDICVNHLAGEPAWQKCVVRTMESGAFRATDVSTAYNDCEPGYVACTRALGVGPRQVSPALNSFVHSICLGGGVNGVSTRERSCMLGLARQSEVLSTQPGLTGKFCTGEGASCFKKFRQTFGVSLSDNSGLNELGRVCENTQGGLHMKECLETVRGTGLQLNQAVGKCEAKLAKETEDCPTWLDDAVQLGTLGDALSSADRQALCAESPGTRACIVTLRRELRRGFRPAWYVCQFADREVRSCIKDFVQGEGAFAGNYDERQAIAGGTIDVMAQDTSRGPQRKLLNAEFACTGSSPFELSCRKKVLRKIRVLGGGEPLELDDRRSRDLVRQVCDTGSVAMQDCVLARRYAKVPTLAQLKQDLLVCADKTVQGDLPAVSAIAAPTSTSPCP